MDKPDLYSKFYRTAAAVLKSENPCNIQRDAAGTVTCRDGKPCCNGCKHLGPEGCTVEALGCKLWLCGSALKAHPAANKTLHIIQRAASAAGVSAYAYRTSKEEAFTPRE